MSEMENRPCLLAFKNGGMKTGNVILQTGSSNQTSRPITALQAAASGQRRPRAAGSWGYVPPHKRRRRQLQGEGEACDSEKHLFTKDGCFFPTQLTLEPTGPTITVSHGSPTTYRQAINKPRIIDRARPSLPLQRQPRPAYQPRPPPSQAAASGRQKASGSGLKWGAVSGNRYRSLAAKTERLRKSFYPQAVRHLNGTD